MKPELACLSARSKALLHGLIFTACFVPVVALADPAGLPPPNWQRAAALQAAALPQPRQEFQNWLDMIDEDRADELLATLQQSTQTGTQTGSPASEAQLFELAKALAEAPQGAAVDAVLLWLANYPSSVLVPHEESPDYGVPLFPVAAAARGSLAERQRHRAEMLSSQLLNASPERWIQWYLSANPLEQQGFNSSLRSAPAGDVLLLATAVHQHLAEHPELAAPAGELASLLLDPQLFLAAFQFSQGAASVSLLREANWRLDAAERSEFLTGMLALDSVEKTALAISVLAPGLHSNPEITENLLQLLDNPHLGAAAALALAGHPGQQVQARLQDMLQAGGLKGRRAAIALNQSPVVQGRVDSAGKDQNAEEQNEEVRPPGNQRKGDPQ